MLKQNPTLVIVYLCIVSLLFGCKKDETATVRPDVLKVLSNAKSITDLSQKQIKEILLYIDETNGAEKKRIVDQLLALAPKMNTDSIKPLKKLSSTSENPGEGSGELYAIQQMEGSYDQFGSVEYAFGGSAGGGGTYFYNWTIAFNSLGFFHVYSRERFELALEGSVAEPRYSINSGSHMGSAISGWAPGFSWTEVGNTLVCGTYTVLSETGGSLAALGFNVFFQSRVITDATTIVLRDGQQR